MSHQINTSKFNFRTDLAIEEVINDNNLLIENINDIKVTTIIIDDSNNKKIRKKDGKYITIEFNDATDFNNSKQIEEIFIQKFKEFLNDYKIKDDDTCLIVGLGNENSTPDSLGPLTINNILVTNHFYFLGINVEEGFRSVAAINPGVMGQTGIETFDIIKSITNQIKPDFIIVIDSLKASQVNKINKQYK